jgi:hypothetical protein
MKEFLCCLLLTLLGCTSKEEFDKASHHANSVVDNLVSDDAIRYFDGTYFNRAQIAEMIGGVRKACDYQNRVGGFVQYNYHVHNGVKIVDFAYEFRMKCDTVRLILTYELGNDPNLIGFKVEPIETPSSLRSVN